MWSNATFKGIAKTGNDIHAEGACALSKALKANKALQTLILRGAIAKKSCRARVQHQKQRQPDNDINDKGACALSEAIKVNTTLVSLYLEGVKQQQGQARQGNRI